MDNSSTPLVFQEIETELLNAIRNKNYSVIAEFAQHYTFHENLLDHVIQSGDVTTLNLLIDSIDVINKTDYFFQAGNHSAEIALELFKYYKDDFAQDTDMLEYDNYSHEFSSKFDQFFIQASKLERFYQPLHYENNKQTFAALLLNNFLNCDRIDENMFPYLDYFLDNREELNIKECDIVQLLCERKYDYEDYTKNKRVKGQLVSLIHYLVDRGMCFESDTQGYLIQIACFNDLHKELLQPLIFNGSSGEGFLARYHDKKNWLTDSEEDELEEVDCNNDRTYSLYKKFDTWCHEFNNDTLHLCEQIQKEFKLKKLHDKLEHTLPINPETGSIGKAKI
jgi:hypothetical protein